MTPTQFRRLGITVKRKLIIRDALKQIQLRRFRPTAGTYVDITSPDTDGNINRENLLALPDKARCTVCAAGSLFLSSVRKANKFDEYGVDQFDILRVTKDFFSEKQMVLIEAAFERTHSPALRGYADGYVSDEAVDRALEFGQRHKTDSKRLVAILKNMLKHDGIFTP